MLAPCDAVLRFCKFFCDVTHFILESLERENLFERILEEADEMDSDEENEDNLMRLGNSTSPEVVRRPSAKLPSNYHNMAPPTNTFTGEIFIVFADN